MDHGVEVQGSRVVQCSHEKASRTTQAGSDNSVAASHSSDWSRQLSSHDR